MSQSYSTTITFIILSYFIILYYLLLPKKTWFNKDSNKCFCKIFVVGGFITSINNTNYYLSSDVKYVNATHKITASTQIISYKTQ